MNDIPAQEYPIFVTTNEVLKLIDGCLIEPYLERAEKGQIKKEVKMGFEEGEKSFQVKNMKYKGYRRAKLVDYAFFKSAFWERKSKKYKEMKSAELYWREFMTYIKGSANAYKEGEGHVSKKMYFQDRAKSALTQSQLEQVWEVFQEYNDWTTKQSLFDETDFVNYILWKMDKDELRCPMMQYVFVDEVQDLPPAVILLLTRIKEASIKYAGDTAQTISQGVNFKFRMLKQVQQLQRIQDLPTNYRSTKQILKLGNQTVNAIVSLFPGMIEKSQPETSPNRGPRPLIVKSEEELMKLLPLNEEESGEVDFNYNQAILVRDKEKVKQLGEHRYFSKAIVTTILDAKGMEYEEVIVWNFFSSSGLKHRDWQLCYQILIEKRDDPLLLSELRFEHTEIASELKKFYVAVTRARSSLILYEQSMPFRDLILPLYDHSFTTDLEEFQKAEIRRQESDFDPMEQSEKGGILRGAELFQKRNFDMSVKCFENARRESLSETVHAYQFAHEASIIASQEDQTREMIKQYRSLFLKAASIFGKYKSVKRAAECYYSGGDYKKAGMLFQKLKKWEEAGECYERIKNWQKAGFCFTEALMFKRALQNYLKLPQKDFQSQIFKFIKRAELLKQESLKKLLTDEALEIMRKMTKDQSIQNKTILVGKFKLATYSLLTFQEMELNSYNMYVKFEDVTNFKTLDFYKLFQSYLAETSTLYEQSFHILSNKTLSLREPPFNSELSSYIRRFLILEPQIVEDASNYKEMNWEEISRSPIFYSSLIPLLRLGYWNYALQISENRAKMNASLSMIFQQFDRAEANYPGVIKTLRVNDPFYNLMKKWGIQRFISESYHTGNPSNVPEDVKAQNWTIIQGMKFIVDPKQNQGIYDIFIGQLKLINRLFQGELDPHTYYSHYFTAGTLLGLIFRRLSFSKSHLNSFLQAFREKSKPQNLFFTYQKLLRLVVALSGQINCEFVNYRQFKWFLESFLFAFGVQTVFGEQGYLFDVFHDSVIIGSNEEIFHEINNFIQKNWPIDLEEDDLKKSVHSDFMHAYCLNGGFMKASMSLVAEVLMNKVLRLTLDLAIDYITHSLTVRDREQELDFYLTKGGYDSSDFQHTHLYFCVTLMIEEIYAILEQKSPSKNLESLIQKYLDLEVKSLSMLKISGSSQYKVNQFFRIKEFLRWRIKIQAIQRMLYLQFPTTEFGSYYSLLMQNEIQRAQLCRQPEFPTLQDEFESALVSLTIELPSHFIFKPMIIELLHKRKYPKLVNHLERYINPLYSLELPDAEKQLLIMKYFSVLILSLAQTSAYIDELVVPRLFQRFFNFAYALDPTSYRQELSMFSNWNFYFLQKLNHCLYLIKRINRRGYISKAILAFLVLNKDKLIQNNRNLLLYVLEELRAIKMTPGQADFFKTILCAFIPKMQLNLVPHKRACIQKEQRAHKEQNKLMRELDPLVLQFYVQFARNALRFSLHNYRKTKKLPQTKQIVWIARKVGQQYFDKMKKIKQIIATLQKIKVRQETKGMRVEYLQNVLSFKASQKTELEESLKPVYQPIKIIILKRDYVPIRPLNQRPYFVGKPLYEFNPSRFAFQEILRLCDLAAQIQKKQAQLYKTELVWQVIAKSKAWRLLNRVLALKVRVFNIFLKRGKYGDRSQLQEFDEIFRELSKSYFEFLKGTKQIIDESHIEGNFDEQNFKPFLDHREKKLDHLGDKIKSIIRSIVYKFDRKHVEAPRTELRTGMQNQRKYIKVAPSTKPTYVRKENR